MLVKAVELIFAYPTLLTLGRRLELGEVFLHLGGLLLIQALDLILA